MTLSKHDELISQVVVADHMRRVAEDRAERAEKVVALFRFLDEVDESTTEDEPATTYVSAWDRVADLVESLDFSHVPPHRADDEP